MSDEEYARELFAILTDPQAVGIDRHDGFGRDVSVTSIEVVDGEHGAELIVEFGLVLPPGPQWCTVPRQGTLRLPVDAQWRELSGYADPAAYAPAVAREVESAAAGHVERHRAVAEAGDVAGPVLPGREEQWRLLVGALARQGEVRQVAPGRIELHDSRRPVLTVLVTPEQWERVLLDHAGGDVVLYLAELLDPRQEDETFVVFYQGDLARSTREGLPPVRGRAFERAIDAVRAQHPDAHFEWRS